MQIVNVKLTTTTVTVDCKCQAIDLINTIEDVINTADISVRHENGKIKYIFEIKA
jgi:hypothetical protein